MLEHDLGAFQEILNVQSTYHGEGNHYPWRVFRVDAYQILQLVRPRNSFSSLLAATMQGVSTLAGDM